MSKKNTNNHGGNRTSAGRKPLFDKAKSFNIYPRASWIEMVGKDIARKVAEDAIRFEYVVQNYVKNGYDREIAEEKACVYISENKLIAI